MSFGSNISFGNWLVGYPEQVRKVVAMVVFVVGTSPMVIAQVHGFQITERDLRELEKALTEKINVLENKQVEVVVNQRQIKRSLEVLQTTVENGQYNNRSNSLDVNYIDSSYSFAVELGKLLGAVLTTIAGMKGIQWIRGK